MIIYAGNQGKIELRAYIDQHPMLGYMLSPGGLTPNRALSQYALDNGAYGCWARGEPFDAYPFLRLLKQCMGHKKYFDFSIIPDKVGAGMHSLRFSTVWLDFLPKEVSWYLAVQDGMKEKHLDELLPKIDGIFVGGTLDWKFKTAEAWVKFAHGHGLKCHVGRTGSYQRLMWCKRINADSCDSSNFAQNKRDWSKMIDFLENGGKQRCL